jgi:capsular polysaccharide biosynthesis protein
MLNSYKTQIVEKEVELSKIGAGVKVAEEEMNRTPEVLKTKKTLDNDSFLNQMVSEASNISIIDSSQIIMKSEEINQNYLNLKMKVSSYRIEKAELEQEVNEIKTKIDDYKINLENTQHDLAEKNYEKTLVERSISISQNTYNAFLQKYEESLIAESTKVGESSIDIVSLAMVPNKPVGPRKMLNLAIGAVLGLMIGVFAAFFRAYWKASAKA